MNFKGIPNAVKDYLIGAANKAREWSIPSGESSNSSLPITVYNVAVIGGGTMGRGIAIALCRAGYKTVLVESNEKALDTCCHELEITYKREMNLKRMTAEDVERFRSNRLILTTELQKVSNCDLVIEAIFENLNMKKELFLKLEKICFTRTIFGTNTSSLNLNEMSSVLLDPSRVVGIHFFNPAHVIRTVEVIYGDKTSGKAVATAFSICQEMEKVQIISVSVLVGNCPNFVFNRLLAVYLNQAHKLLWQYGMSPKDVDQIVTSFGFLMGPITMHDMNGLDIGVKVKEAYNVELNPIEKALLDRNRLGRKNGKGFYMYDPITNKKSVDMEVEDLIRHLAYGQKINIQLYCDSDVMEFLLFPMVNEGYLCLEEGIIREECLIDIMLVLGFGWPMASGGPMSWGREVGLHKIEEKIRHWHQLEPYDRSYKQSTALFEVSKNKAHL